MVGKSEDEARLLHSPRWRIKFYRTIASSNPEFTATCGKQGRALTTKLHFGATRGFDFNANLGCWRANLLLPDSFVIAIPCHTHFEQSEFRENGEFDERLAQRCVLSQKNR